MLKNTLNKTSLMVETGNRAGDLDTNISNLSSAYRPGSIADFNSVMQSVSQLAYQTRQTAEQAQLDRQFDPTKVSGGTFADIMGFVESHRGADISRIASSTTRAYGEAQQQIGQTLENMKADRNKLQADARQFKFEMASKYPGLYNNLSDDEKQSIDDGEPSLGVFAKFDAYTAEAKAKEDAWEAEKRAMTRASYAKTNASNGREKEMDALFMMTAEHLRTNKEVDGGLGLDGYANPQVVNDWIQYGITVFGEDYANYAKKYDFFLAPGKSASDIAFERKQFEQQQKDQAEVDLFDYTSSAKKDFYDSGKGLWNREDKDEIIWNDFLRANPNVAEDRSLQMKIRQQLEKDGYTVR